MDTTTGTRRALVVRGGWEGHQPAACTDLFLPCLREHGFDVLVREDLEVYADTELLRSFSLIVQCWTGGALTPDQEDGLVGAVTRGAGFAGWHGGVLATFDAAYRYQFMVGGHFVAHPGDFVDYRVEIVGSHPIVSGLDGFNVHTEQYFCHVDPTLRVHATTTFDGGHGAPDTAGAVMPVVWTRHFQKGRVFVCTLGHSPEDLLVPQTRRIVERGLLWAGSAAYGD